MDDEMRKVLDFLLARIEDDERIAQLVASQSPTSEDEYCVWATPFVIDPERMVVAIDYQRVQAECVAKRKMIDGFRELERRRSPFNESAIVCLETVLRLLASAYSAESESRETLLAWGY